MPVLKELQDPQLVKKATLRICELGQQAAVRLGRKPVLMEVCGTHTVAVSRSGLRGLLQDALELKSGPGCPVCVTSQADIDRLIAIARLPGVTIATFGDMVRVPGSASSLEVERAAGADVRIIYSPLEAVNLAREHPEREVVLAGVGFETTAPAVALAIKEAASQGIGNFSVLSLHKTMPPVLRTLLQDKELVLDGLILPGHVCTIAGRLPFDFIATDYGIPAAVTGFEPLDILAALEVLLRQAISGQPAVANVYRRLVAEDGNARARAVLAEYFTPVEVMWRGLGSIPASGLQIAAPYRHFDAAHRFPVTPLTGSGFPGCRCGELLAGKISPPRCPLFARQCTPNHPVGPCMVSSEGACAAYYHYEHRAEVGNKPDGR